MGIHVNRRGYPAYYERHIMPTSDTGVESVPRTSLTRDLITVGVFTALYFAIKYVFGQLGALTAITQVLGPAYIPILCGIPFALFLSRVRRFGLITGMGWIVGILYIITGMSIVTTILAFTLSIVADVVAYLGRYKRWPLLVLAYVIFSEMAIGSVIPLFFQRDRVLASIAKRHDQAWVDQVATLTPMWMFYGMIVMLAVGAIIGLVVGRAIFRKHFSYLTTGKTASN